MADVIKLVQGDEKPSILLTLTNDVDSLPIDLSASTTVVRIKFREAGTTALLSTITCTKIGTGATGEVTFNFAGGILDVDPGAYEGEIIVDYNSDVQTLYDVLRFRVRENF
jgi:hypothetical protein